MSFMLLGILNSQAAGGGGAGAYDLLESTTLTTEVSSLSFTGLGAYASSYKHLQIRCVARAGASTGAGQLDLDIELNGDTGSNYATHRLTANGSSVTSSGGGSRTEMEISDFVLGTDSPAGAFGVAVVDFLDAFSNTKNTTIRALAGETGGTDPKITLNSGAWFNTDSITSMLIDMNGSLFGVNSRFSLYGVK